MDSNGDKLSGAITTQFYSDKGKLLEQYTWWLGEDVDDDMPDGWYDLNMEEPKERELDYGEGFFVNTSSSDGKLLYAGQVELAAVAIPVTKGLAMKGNFRPTDIKMSDISVVNSGDDPMSGAVTIQFYGATGKLLEQYTWWLGEDVDDDMPDGWYDLNMDEVKDRVIAAGEGFCTNTSSTESYLKFKAL